MYKFFKYIEPLWIGTAGKISIRRVLAIVFSVDFVMNMSYAIRQWESTKSYADAALLLGVEASLIAALLTLTTYSNALKAKINAGPDNNPKNTTAAPFD